ncbi:inositol-3-phosphate synthase 1-A-like protein [Euroglyphus maynei]|uniref:inositol-3-phosphate synthase n=1 Tax=Euroglyphus maynei TaxID=6958 RepID=A0A1Y3BRV7_EURMA|nr:inositol-3-phosphate synthase 1-A-like protein [Euroglyphus maynei]
MATNNNDNATTMKVNVQSPNIRYTDETIEADYEYDNVKCIPDDKTNSVKVYPMRSVITFRTERRIPRTGLMMIGWGGNNGTTVTASIIANKHRMSFMTKDGEVKANYFGSITQSSTIFLGYDAHGKELFIPMKDILPMVDPNDLFIDGWDISGMNLADAMKRAKVLDINLQEQLRPFMEKYRPRRAIYDLDFIAANQENRADNVIDCQDKWSQVEQIRADIRDFKQQNNLDTVIVLWTANTERFSDVIDGIHDTADNLLAAIKRNEKELAPSALYAVAAILEKVIYYYFYCNNDGFNLSAPKQFRSKEISKSNVVDDMVESNQILYGQGKNHPDHTVVIKYVPYVGDSKRAMDEYISELMLGGKNTIVVHNTCEDSLLASPIILDLTILAELCQRVTFKIHNHSKF